MKWAGRWWLTPINLSYSRGRDQEDRSSKPVRANSWQDPISRIPITERTGGVAQGEGPKFKPQYCKKKKKRKLMKWVLP
jgi:hypothetical protein